MYRTPGTYDVRLTVTGVAGAVSRQKAGFVTVDPPVRGLEAVPRPRPTPRTLPPR